MSTLYEVTRPASGNGRTFVPGSLVTADDLGGESALRSALSKGTVLPVGDAEPASDIRKEEASLREIEIASLQNRIAELTDQLHGEIQARASAEGRLAQLAVQLTETDILDRATVDTVAAFAGIFGLEAEGTKADIIARLQSALRGPAPEPEGQNAEPEAASGK